MNIALFPKMIQAPVQPAEPVTVQFTCYEYSENRVAISTKYAELEVVHSTAVYSEPTFGHDHSSNDGYLANQNGMAYTASTQVKQVFHRISDDKLIDVSLIYFLDKPLLENLREAIEVEAQNHALREFEKTVDSYEPDSYPD